MVETLDRLDAAHDLVLATFAKVVYVGPEFEASMLDHLRNIARGEAVAGELGGPTPDDLDLLGDRAASVIRYGRAFQREVLGILADGDTADTGTRLDEAVRRYRTRADLALSVEPKNMDVLYDHGAALEFRTRYPRVGGFLWAGHWYRLAVTEPLTDLPPGPERAAGVDTVATRYFAKLAESDPPDAFPTELPLAPAIAPGLVWASPEAAAVFDNLSMLQEVLADILASTPMVERPAAIASTVDFFVTSGVGETDRITWETMALRHGIFFQGGFPLAVMTRSERNAHGHGAHMRSGAPMVIPGMGGR